MNDFDLSREVQRHEAAAKKGLANSETRDSPIGNKCPLGLPPNPVSQGARDLEPAAETVLRSKLWVQPSGNQS